MIWQLLVVYWFGLQDSSSRNNFDFDLFFQKKSLSLKLVLKRAWASGCVAWWIEIRPEKKNVKSKVSEKIKHRDHDNSLSKWKSSKVEKKFQRLQICKECVEKMTQNAEVKMLYFEQLVKSRCGIFLFSVC